MTKRTATKLLKSEKQIVALDLQSYLIFLALRIEIGCRNLNTPLAEVVKGWEGA